MAIRVDKSKGCFKRLIVNLLQIVQNDICSFFLMDLFWSTFWVSSSEFGTRLRCVARTVSWLWTISSAALLGMVGMFEVSCDKSDQSWSRPPRSVLLQYYNNPITQVLRRWVRWGRVPVLLGPCAFLTTAASPSGHRINLYPGEKNNPMNQEIIDLREQTRKTLVLSFDK